MPTVEELYRNYGILADATEQVGQVGPRPGGPAARGVGLPPRWAASRGAHSGRERGLGLLGSARSRSPAFPRSPGTHIQPLRLSHFPDCDEMESFPQEIKIVGSGGRSCEWCRKSRIQGLCNAPTGPCRPDLDRSLAAAAFGRLAGTQLWRALEARCQLRAPLATSDARGKDKRFVLFLNGRIFVKKVAGLW